MSVNFRENIKIGTEVSVYFDVEKQQSSEMF